jgi:tripartite-type tricarboxylate transporter receptor subunit TctC
MPSVGRPARARARQRGELDVLSPADKAEMMAASIPQIKEGNVRALAITSKRRSQILPDVPTMTEAGYPEIEGDTWVGVLVPAGTSKDVINFLNREVVKIIAMPDIEVAELGYDPVASTPEEFAVGAGADGQHPNGTRTPHCYHRS